MSAGFAFPEWWTPAPQPPPPPVDSDRLEGLVNRFLAGKQEALHTAPNAFLRRSSAEAVDSAPAMVDYLSLLRDSLLDQARDSHERAALEPKLAVNLDLARAAIARHVAEQRQVFNRQTALERQALIRRAAELSTGDHDLAGLPEANATVAQSLARMTGEPEEPLMQAARSEVWRSAIGQRLATGQGASAIGLFDRVKGELVPADQRALDVPIQVARTDAAAEAWITREAKKEGEPLAARLQADTGLSPVEKSTTLAKIEARESARESARVATVQGLEDKFEETADSLATKPDTYKPGTLSALASAYEDAGASDTAAPIRRLAHQESFLLNFARSNAAAQQRLIDSLPEGDDRVAAESIQHHQAEAFAKDAFAAGTALYPDVGPPAPIGDLTDRIAQARTISAYRGIPVAPFTVDEIAALRRKLVDGTPQERGALLTQLNALPDDMTGAIASNDLLSVQPVTFATEGARELYQQGTDDSESTPASGFTPTVVRSTQGLLAKDLFTLVQDVKENKQRGDAARDALIEHIKSIDRGAKIVKEVQIHAPIFPEVYMVADVIFRGNGVSELNIVEVKTGEARLSKQQAAILAKALNDGDVQIVSEGKAKKLGIRPKETFKAQSILPRVVVIGGDHATIVRQLMNEGVDIGGRRSRFRLGVPPN